MVIKSGNVKTVEIHLPSWMLNKWFLAAMAVVIIAGFIYMSPGLNTAVFGTNAKTSSDSSPEVKTAETSATEQTAVFANTDWQAKLEADRNDPVLGQKIAELEEMKINLALLIPINAIPNKFEVLPSIYISDLAINQDGMIKGFIENKKSSNVEFNDFSFNLIEQDYTSVTIYGLHVMNGPITSTGNIIAPGERKFFTTNGASNAKERSRVIEKSFFVIPRISIR